MKRIILLIVFIIGVFLLPIPSYVELNNLAIIEGIGVEYENDAYSVYLKEIIPMRQEQGIEYEYHYYEGTSSSVSKALLKIQEKEKKKLYLKRSKFLVTNVTDSFSVLKELDISLSTIYHPQTDVFKKLKETKS